MELNIPKWSVKIVDGKLTIVEEESTVLADRSAVDPQVIETQRWLTIFPGLFIATDIFGVSMVSLEENCPRGGQVG